MMKNERGNEDGFWSNKREFDKIKIHKQGSMV